jgi:beta-galactosidase GanA
VLAKWLLRLNGLQPSFTTADGIEIAERRKDNQLLHFVLNHTSNSQSLHLENHFRNLLNQRELAGDVEIAPYEVLILSSEIHE